MSKRVLSGIRATGQLHLGNYLGAVSGMLALQDSSEYETLYMVADAHAITTPYDVNQLRRQRREIIIDYLAAGLDPQKSILFCQADIPYHFELAFYFASVTTVAKMQHLPTFKEKVKQYPNFTSLALLNYPVLQAADILLYQGELVPVGIDQEPHLEVARDIARKMNQDYGTNFPEPQRFATKGEYIPSLTGEGKMSKSVAGSYILLTDDLDTIRKKVRSVPTATEVGGKMSRGVEVLFTLLNFFAPEKHIAFLEKFAGGTLKYVELKDTVTQAIYQELEPFQAKRQEILSDPQYVDQIIAEGTEKALAIAQDTIQEVKQKIGLAS